MFNFLTTVLKTYLCALIWLVLLFRIIPMQVITLRNPFFSAVISSLLLSFHFPCYQQEFIWVFLILKVKNSLPWR